MGHTWKIARPALFAVPAHPWSSVKPVVHLAPHRIKMIVHSSACWEKMDSDFWEYRHGHLMNDDFFWGINLAFIGVLIIYIYIKTKCTVPFSKYVAWWCIKWVVCFLLFWVWSEITFKSKTFHFGSISWSNILLTENWNYNLCLTKWID